MNVNSIINMVVRLVMRRIVSKGINAGMDAATSRMSKGRPEGGLRSIRAPRKNARNKPCGWRVKSAACNTAQVLKCFDSFRPCP